MQQDDNVSVVNNTGDLQQDETTPAGLNSTTTDLASSQADNDGDPSTRPYDLRCTDDGKDGYIDDESSPTEGDAMDEIAPTVDCNHGDAHLVPQKVTYTCQDHMVCFKTVSEESEITESCVEQNNTDNTLTNIEECDPTKNDAKIDIVGNDGNTVNTPHRSNVLYPLTTCIQNDQARNQMYAQNVADTETPNPMYGQNAINCTSVYKPKSCDHNPMYAPDLPLPATESDPTPAQSGTAKSSGTVETTAEDLNPKADTDIEAQASRDTEAGKSASWQTDTGTVETTAEDLNPKADTDIEPQASRDTEAGERFNITPYAVRYQTDDDNDDIVTRRNDAIGRGQIQSSIPGNADIEPYAVRYEDDEDLTARRNATNNKRTQDVSPKNVNIEPYAVRYENDEDMAARRNATNNKQTQSSIPGNVDIEPYAVRYENDEDMAARRSTPENERKQDVSPDNVNIEPYAVRYEDDEDGTTDGTVLGGSSDARGVGNQAPIHVQNGPQQNCDGSHDINDRTLMVVPVGTGGGSLNQIRSHRGVAVSADNEIFVTDFQKRRVHVYNISGAYRRFFRTIVPGVAVKKMQPSDVALDGEGHLWVVGKSKNNVKTQVAQYSRNGQPLSKFDVNFKSKNPGIAVDVTDHKVIITSMHGVLIYQPNGSLHLRFGEKRQFPVSYVTTDSEGNILVSTAGEIQVYNRYGTRLFTFRTLGLEGRSGIPRGICLDTLGRIIVTKVLPARIDMYTSRGGFVRTIANITNPAGVAMGPDGQLVVANALLGTVTIFPRQLVYM
uniref:SMP-30/Gluconolactonase/LRE-like region domain-containing protein n=1 Tax=Branchiostoma floridae TaxID=7739 RepID=C3Y4X0_BRAFL|eukprot:XP_002608767.1 hypothetical protein BRAFLDRAFT_73993 [Branchiostoma floridae]